MFPGCLPEGMRCWVPGRLSRPSPRARRRLVPIDRYLQGQDLLIDREKVYEIAKPEVTGILRETRFRPRLRDPRERRRDFEEVVEVMTPGEARQEAGRCLACGICSECYQCLAGLPGRGYRPRPDRRETHPADRGGDRLPGIRDL